METMGCSYCGYEKDVSPPANIAAENSKILNSRLLQREQKLNQYLFPIRCYDTTSKESFDITKNILVTQNFIISFI